MKLVRFSMFWLLFAVSFQAPAQAKKVSDLPNFHQVTENLYRGGRPTARGLQKLAEMGIRTIINLQGGDLNSFMSPLLKITEPGERAEAIEREQKAWESLGLNFIPEPLDSIDRVSASEAQAIDRILNEFNDPSLQPIYVHCEHGKDRTGLLVALERVQDENWSVEDARKEWIHYGHGFVNRIFTGAMDRYFRVAVAHDE